MRQGSKIDDRWDSQSQYTPLCEASKKIKDSVSQTRRKQRMPVDHTEAAFTPKKTKGEYFWNETENIKYCQFVERNLHLLLKPLKERKILKINILMSKYIKTRTPSQCRSHHQKMLLNHGNVLELLDFLKGSEPQQGVETEIQIEQKSQPQLNTHPELKFIEETQPSSSSLWESLISSADFLI